MKYLEETKKFIDSLLKGKSSKHFDRTVDWLKIIYPDYDEALLVASYSHDVERLSSTRDTSKDNKFLDDSGLRFHQEEGGRIMEKFLLEVGATQEFASRVNHLISYHEDGGDEEQNVLKDADSISYFEVNAPLHATWVEKGFPKEELKKKFDWMFERITLKNAKDIALPLYQEALSLIGFKKENN